MTDCDYCESIEVMTGVRHCPIHGAANAPMKPNKLPVEFWHVYNYLAGQWYHLEYGQVEQPDRWYQPGMLFLERFAAGTPQ